MIEPIQQMIQAPETTLAIAKVAPAVGGGVWYHYTLNEWVLIATLVYIILQAGLLVPQYVKIFKRWKNKDIEKSD